MVEKSYIDFGCLATELQYSIDAMSCFFDFTEESGHFIGCNNLQERKNRALSFLERFDQHQSILFLAADNLMKIKKEIEDIEDEMLNNGGGQGGKNDE